MLDNGDDDNDDDNDDEDENGDEDAMGKCLVHIWLHSLSAGLDVRRHLYMLDNSDGDNDDKDKKEEEDDKEEEEDAMGARVLSTPVCTLSLQVWMSRDTCTTC